MAAACSLFEQIDDVIAELDEKLEQNKQAERAADNEANSLQVQNNAEEVNLRIKVEDASSGSAIQ